MICHCVTISSRYLYLWRSEWGNPRRWRRRRNATQGHLHPVVLCTYVNDL